MFWISNLHSFLICHLLLLINLHLCWPFLLSAGSLITVLTWQFLQEHCIPGKVLLTCRLCWLTHHLILKNQESLQRLQSYSIPSLLFPASFDVGEIVGLFPWQFGKIITTSFPWIFMLLGASHHEQRVYPSLLTSHFSIF
jgi:hypothetical protein